MSNLSDPDCRSCPMVDNKSPSKPMANPRSCALRLKPLREVMQAIPITESMNSSGEPKVRTRGRTMGIARARVSAPIKPPQRAHQRRAKRAARLAALCHGVAIHDCGS